MTAAGLARIEHDHPGWHCWRGVTGLLYARRRLSSPPAVCRATTIDGLEHAVTEQEQRWAAARRRRTT